MASVVLRAVAGSPAPPQMADHVRVSGERRLTEVEIPGFQL